MREQLQPTGLDVNEARHSWPLGKLIFISGLLQLVIFSLAGFWGILYAALLALAVMWLCTTFGVVHQPGPQEEAPHAYSEHLSTSSQN